MSISTIIEYTKVNNRLGLPPICRDVNVLGNNVYLDNGQGCGTIWFSSVPVARKALIKDGIKTGRDLSDCSKCSCHYPGHDIRHSHYPEFLCRLEKEKYAKSFEGKPAKDRAGVLAEQALLEAIGHFVLDCDGRANRMEFYNSLRFSKDPGIGCANFGVLVHRKFAGYTASHLLDEINHEKGMLIRFFDNTTIALGLKEVTV